MRSFRLPAIRDKQLPQHIYIALSRNWAVIYTHFLKCTLRHQYGVDYFHVLALQRRELGKKTALVDRLRTAAATDRHFAESSGEQIDLSLKYVDD
jgi:hypothetical protein